MNRESQFLKESGELAGKFSQVGWQSWSRAGESPRRFIKILAILYPPSPANFLPPILAKISLKKPAWGWGSWYAFGRAVDEEKILRQVRWLADHPEVPVKYILLDGGWTRFGDWLTADKNKFPSGLERLVKEIKKYGFLPGVWIAPFVVEPRSQLAREHPAWIVQDHGRPVDGFRLTPLDRFIPYKRWFLDLYLLDAKQSQVQKYLEGSIARLLGGIGFSLIKLDFLYANHFNPSLSSDEADRFLRQFLLAVKKKYPGVYTLASGCPLVSAVGAVDAMRIGPDLSISPFLDKVPHAARQIIDYFYLRTSLATLERNLSERSWTRRFWNLNVDDFVCGKRFGHLQKLVRAARGDIFLGDDLAALSQEEVERFILPLFRPESG